MKTVLQRKWNRAAIVSLITLAASQASAQSTFYWDANGDVAGAGATPTGTWGTDAFWSIDPLGAVPTGAWTAGSIATFSAGSDATGPFTLTISGTQTVSGMVIEEGAITIPAGAVGLGGTGTLGINTGASLSINSSTRISGTAGSKVVLNGGTLIQTNPSSAGSFIPATVNLEVGATGGTVNYTSSGTGTVALYGGTSGTIIGTGILTKDGLHEFRYQGVGLPNTTYSKLVVNQGLFRLGFNQSVQDERGFGAVPGSFTPDAITLNNGGSIGTSFTVTLHANRGITLGPGGGAFNMSAGSMTIPGSVTGSGNLIKNTTGTLTLNGVNDYTGQTIITTGIVNIGTATALGSIVGNTQISAVGELRIDGATKTFTLDEPLEIAGPGGGGGGAITIQNLSNPTIAGPVTLTGDATVTVSSTATGRFTNPAAFTSASNRTLTLQGGSGAGGGAFISGSIALGSGGVTKLQSGTWTLSGVNTYTGVTNIGAGTLQFAKQVSLYNNNPASWTATNIVVSSGATLAVNVGGAGEFTATDLDTLTDLGTATGGFLAGSNIGIDTSNATGGNFTYGGITNPNAGANALGLVKRGLGSLTLTGSNTYTGVTSITNGSLIVTGDVTGTSLVSISGLLGGTGTVAPALNGNINLAAGGKLAPGTSIGTLTATLSGTGELDLTAGINTSTLGLQFELDTPLLSDRVIVNGGALEIGAGLLNFDDFAFTTLSGFDNGDYLLFDGNVPISGTLGSNLTGILGGRDGEVMLADNNQDVILRVIPEPGSAMLLLGGLAIGALRRRRS